MLKILGCWLAGFVWVAVPFSAGAQGTVQRGGVGLHVSEGRMLNLDRDAQNVMVGDASIADVQAVSPRQLYVYGRKPGLTTLTAIDARTGNAAQMTINVTRGAAAAQSTLPPGSSVSFDQNRLIVRGRVANLGQALETNSTAQQFNASRQPPLDRTRLAGAQQITLRVRVAEVSRSTLNQLGLNLNVLANPGSFAFGLMTGSFLGQAAASTLTTSLAGGTPAGSFGQATAGVSSGRVNGQALLNALQSEGLLITLAEPNLTTISGETASFRAGGEIPIPVPQALGVTTIEYKKYGVQLTFTPVLLPDNRIAMKVHPSVSELSTANAVSIGGVSVPAIIERDAETQVEMASGQTLSIAGLFQRNEQVNISKFPGLGDIPVIGALFRSTSYQHNETELVILVTPYLSQPVSDPSAFQVPSQAPASAAPGPAPVAAGVRGELRVRAVFALVVALPAAACTMAAPEAADQYRLAAFDVALPVGFSSGSAALLPGDRQSLVQLTRTLPESVVPDVYAAGPLAAARVIEIGAVLQRQTRWVQDGRIDPERVVVFVHAPGEIVADACRGPGVHLPGDIWPGSEARTAMILPPGCAVANSIKAQVTSQDDLLQGRPLPPGAALPYAAAIERYYHRNDQAQSATANASSSGGDGGSGVSAGASADPARNAAGQQNPLLGPLTASPGRVSSP